MNEWKTIPLGELCDVTAGGTPSRSNSAYFGGAIPWVKIGDMLQDPVTVTDETISQAALDNSAAKLLPPGTVLISIFATIGRTAVLGVEAATNQAIAGVTPRDANTLTTEYLRLYFNSVVTMLERRARGVAQVNINSGILRALPIPLPPLAEQRRIAKVLDRAEALRAKRRGALAQLDTLTQALFLDLFGDADENQDRWPVRPVSDYVAEFQAGKSIEAEGDENVVTRNRVLKVSAVTGMKFLAHESKPVPDSYEPPPEHFAKPGDLLFSRANTTELVGAIAYVDTTPPNVLLPDKLWRFVWRKPIIVEPLFVWALFQTRPLRREIGRRATGTSGSMKNISQEKVFGISTILPPLDLQHAFARRVAAVEKLKTAHRASLAELDALFAALQHRAFRGEL